MELVVPGADDGRGEDRLRLAAALESAADVHGDVGDLVVVDRRAESVVQSTGYRDGDLEDHRVRGLERAGERVAGQRALLGASHQVLHVQGEAQHERLVDQIDLEVLRRPRDLGADGGLDPWVDTAAGDITRGVLSRGHDAREHEGGEMAAVTVSERDREVLLGEAGDHGADPRDLVACSGGPRLERVPCRDPLGRDGDVQKDVGDRELVDVIALLAELAHELGFERADGIGGDDPSGERAAEGLGMERCRVHLVVRQPRQQAPLGGLVTPQPHDLSVSLKGEIRAVEQRAHAGEVSLESGLAHVQRIGRREDVDAVRHIEQGAHETVQTVARSRLAALPGAQCIASARPGAVAGGA